MSEDKFLSDYSPRDAVWDTQRTLTDSVGGIYQTAAEFEFVTFWLVYHHGNRRNAPTAS